MLLLFSFKGEDLDTVMAKRITHEEIKSEIRAICLSARGCDHLPVHLVERQGTDSSWKS